MFRIMRALAIVLIFRVAAQDSPLGFGPLPPEQRMDLTVYVPELKGGSFQLPTIEWECYAQSTTHKSGRAYAIVNAAHDTPFVLTFLNLDMSKTKNMDEFISGTRSGLTKRGLTIELEKMDKPATFPPHESAVRGYYKGRHPVNNETVWMHFIIVPIGSQSFIMVSYSKDGDESPFAVLLARSVKYTASPTREDSDMLAAYSFGFWGGVFAAIGSLLNRIAGRRIVNPPGIACGIIVLFAGTFCVFLGMRGAWEGAGRIFGSALIPTLVFFYFYKTGKNATQSKIEIK